MAGGGFGIISNTKDIVTIITDRSPEMVVAIFAILKAGGAYLPISPDYPEDRVNYMLEDSGTDILLIHKGFSLGIKFGM